jgi:hypothetical protein
MRRLSTDGGTERPGFLVIKERLMVCPKRG